MTTSFNRLTAGVGALEAARELTGRPYVYGGTWPQSGGTDCSGLVQFAYAKVGVHLPRTTYEQFTIHQLPSSAKNEPGDLLFIAGSDPIGNKPGHVMIYVSPGQVFQAPFTGEDIGQYPYDTDVFEYRTRPALALPLPITPTKNPTEADLANAGLVLLANPSQARIALSNGWPLYVWNGVSFSLATGKQVKGTPEYANKNYARKA